MAFLVLAFPSLDTQDFDWIQSYRKEHDELFGIVDPHFTFVFPVVDRTKDAFINEVQVQTKGVKSIDFEIRCATISHDAFRDYYHEFLVPDRGYSSIVKLHDRLYSGTLSDNLRLDIDFIPHIGIGKSNDPHLCKSNIDKLNRMDFSIPGRIESLTVIEYESNVVTKIADIQLD